MIRSLTYGSIIVLFFVSLPLLAQSIENVEASVTEDKMVAISYDLVGNPDKERYKIEIFSSHNGFSTPLAAVTGDVSNEFTITPGTSKRVVWDASKELDRFNGELSFEVRAQVYFMLDVTNPSGSKAVRRGKVHNIAWSGGMPSEEIRIELIKSGRSIATLATTGNSGNYKWSVPKEIEKGSDYTIRCSTESGQATSESFSINAKYPLLLKVGVPAAIVAGTILLISGGDDDGALPVPPEPN